MKRVFDFIVSGVLALFLLPVTIVIALAVKVLLGGPVIFKQRRPGLNGDPFMILKFRSMKVAYDEYGSLLPDDQRLTKFGRVLRASSLDELPSLWNVLRGDMSLVGPRPLLMQYLPLYNPTQARRHCVRPGLTGWAQVNGRNTVEWEQKFLYDVWYVDNQSLLLDIKILCMTAGKVLKREGISQAGQATMSPFLGSIPNTGVQMEHKMHNEILSLIDEAMEAEEGTAQLGQELVWDSVAVVIFMGLVDERFEKTLSADRLVACQTVDDVVALVG